MLASIARLVVLEIFPKNPCLLSQVSVAEQIQRENDNTRRPVELCIIGLMSREKPVLNCYGVNE